LCRGLAGIYKPAALAASGHGWHFFRIIELMMQPPALPPPARLAAFLSQKLRFWSLVAMVLLIYVHGFNLHPRFLSPWTLVEEPLTPGSWLQYFLANGLLRFRIPILFAISGYLLARRESQEPHRLRMRRRLPTLGRPYLLWSAIWLGLTWALEQFPVTRQAVVDARLGRLVSEASPQLIVAAWVLFPIPFQLWFLRHLLFYNLAYPWLKKAILRWPKWYFGVAGLLWLLMVSFWPVAEGEGLLFFGLGLWLALHDKDVLTPPRWFRLAPAVALWLGSSALKTWLAFQPGPAPDELMLLLHKVGEASGVLTAWFGLDGLVRACMSRGWFRWLTGFSFMIYVLHAPLVNYATELALRYGRGVPHIHLLTYLLLPLLIVAFAAGFGALLRRLAPGLYSTLTGGRGLATS
jgi:fucose 4-O-acetylase-like acetyltransferase